jgi:urease accessory protein
VGQLSTKAGTKDVAGGCANLVFSRDSEGASFVSWQYTTYPYHICRAHRFPGDPDGMVTLYLQSCAGGIFQHDRLHESIDVQAATQAHVTTQASTIVHGMEAGAAELHVRLIAGAGAFLEFLPDPFILFPRARLKTRLEIHADEEATVITCEAFLMHDPAGGAKVFDWLIQDTTVEMPGGHLVSLDRSRVTGDAMVAGIPGITGAYRAHGSLFVLHRGRPASVLVDALRGALFGIVGIYAGASTLPNEAGAWVRLLAKDGVALRATLHSAWSAVRQLLTGIPPQIRRK